VINFYYDIQDDLSLNALLNLDINTVIPILVIGDFDAHSQVQSLLNVLFFKRATCIEEWAAMNLLTLVNTPKKII
jgi:hypothetical protein